MGCLFFVWVTIHVVLCKRNHVVHEKRCKKMHIVAFHYRNKCWDDSLETLLNCSSSTWKEGCEKWLYWIHKKKKGITKCKVPVITFKCSTVFVIETVLMPSLLTCFTLPLLLRIKCSGAGDFVFSLVSELVEGTCFSVAFRGRLWIYCSSHSVRNLVILSSLWFRSLFRELSFP